MPERTTVAAPVSEVSPDGLDRLVLGAGVVAGELEDGGREDDPDDHGADGDHPRVVDRRGRAGTQLGEGARQVGEARDGAEHGRDAGRQVERAVDRPQRVLPGAGPGEEDADQRGDHADGGDDQREDQTGLAERRLAEDQRGDQRHGVRLEEVRRHAGAVTDVVAHVVGDGGRVARVVLGDVLLDLADEVGADVGGLGEDAAADPHEHGEHGGAEAEALEDRRGVALEHEHDEGGAQQAEAHGRHAHVRAGAEGDPDGRGAALDAGPGRRGHAQVGAGGQPHAEVADQAGEHRAREEGDRPGDPQAPVRTLLVGVGRQRQQQEERDDGEDAQRAELAAEEGGRALLHRAGDVLHRRGAVAGGEAPRAGRRPRHEQRHQRDHTHDGDEGEVACGQRRDGHRGSSCEWLRGTRAKVSAAQIQPARRTRPRVQTGAV